MSFKLGSLVFDELYSSPRPVVLEGFVVSLLHELIHMYEEQKSVRSIWQVPIRGDESIVDGCQSLLSIEDDVFGVAISVVAVNLFACQSIKVFLLPFPQQQAADVVVEENRSH